MPPIAHRALRTPFVGRGRELLEIESWRADTDAWLLTVLGAPGAGKTRLAHEASESADGELLWVDLHAASSGEVLPRIAAAAGLRTSDVAAVARSIRERVDLLVLDECETAVDGVVSVLVALSSAVPSLRVLATSRRPLGLAGERALRLDAFGKPDPARPIDESDSGQLFLERVRARQPGYQLDPAEQRSARAILERLGDLPLAIELVAIHVAELGAAAVAARLDTPLRVLSGERNDDPRASLAVALGESFGALDDAQRSAVVRLAALERAFDLEDAEAVLGSAGLELVRALRDRSWLVKAGPEAFDLLPPMRHFLSERREALDDETTARVDRAWIEGTSRGRVPPLDGLLAAVGRTLHDPTRAAAAVESLAHAHAPFAAAGRLADLAREARSFASLSLAPGFLRIAARAALECGLFDEAASAIAALREAGDEDEASLLEARVDFRVGRYDRLAQLELPRGRVKVEHVEVLATAASIRGELDRALAIYDRALAVADRAEVPMLRAMLARLLAEIGRDHAALEQVEAARGAGPLAATVDASLDATRALVAHDRGSMGASITLYDAVIPRYAAMGNVIACILRFMRMIAALEDGRFAEARASAMAALDDAPRSMAQLAPLIELAEWVAHGVAPAGAPPAVPVIAASTALVRAYVARSCGDVSTLEAALLGNAPHEKWSVTSRTLTRLARSAAAPGPIDRAREILVGPGGAWFAVPEGAQVSLATRPVLQRVLSCLVARAGGDAASFASIDVIAAAAWPGERIVERAKRSRVHVAIATLRALGLRDQLISDRAAGYRLALPARVPSG
jgi:tetratricopeptide (TPR) repeat protein